MKYADNFKYLGFTFSFDLKDDKDMLRQLRNVYTKFNRVLRLFHCCSTDERLHYFAPTVYVFIVLSCGHIIRNQLTVS